VRTTGRNAIVGAAFLIVVLVTLGAKAHAQDADFKCRETINKQYATYVKTTTKILQKCNETDVKAGNGQSAPGGNGGNFAPCDMAGKIPAALTKMTTKITGKCDNASPSITPAQIGWPGTCPNFEGGTCANAITDGASVAICLDCIAKAAIAQAMDLYYVNLSNPLGDSDVIKCQTTIGKETSKFLLAKDKALANCRKAIDKGAPGTCPAADGKAGPAIAKAESKKVSKICKACGTTSLDGSTCTGQTITPAEIGFASFCPPVTVPGGGPACGGPINTITDLVKCVDCVTDFKVDCADALSRPDQAAYPPQCGLPPTPPLLQRPTDPVILPGADVAARLTGIAPSELVAFRYDGGWVQLPVQVDERATINFDDVYNNTSFPPWGSGGGFTTLGYTDAGTFTGADPDTTLDADDEIVFMAADAGQRPGGFSEPAGVMPNSGMEIAISDPLTGDAGYVYLFRQNGSLDPTAGQQYVSYTFQLLSGNYKTTYQIANGPNPENSTVSTSEYARHFSDRWLEDEMQIFSGVATGVNILDRNKMLFFPSYCGRSEDTFDGDGVNISEGAFVINKDGPVRALRSYVGANSGPRSQREHLFYRGREDVTAFLRVHGIPGIMTFNDYSPAAAGMTYANINTPAGVTIDGVGDTLVPGELKWELVTGPQGSVVIVNAVETNIPGIAPTSYYLDDASGSPADIQCTGDAFAYGSSGPWINQSIPDTDPNDPSSGTNYLNGRQVLYYDVPGLTAADAAQRLAWVTNPLSHTSSPWQ
jgi:hypothetical protein